MRIIIFCLVILLTCGILQVTTTVPNSLKLVHIIFRHGERTPTATYKTDPYRHWPEGWGELTNRGKRQMYDLGLMLREYYKDFLPYYYFPDNVQVLSSYADRCLMSAEALLAGLFPPVKEQIWNSNLLWQPIPIKYLPRLLDNKIALKRKCPVYDAALKLAYKSERIQNINARNKNLYRYLTENTGQEISNISTVETLHGTLEIEQLHNLSLPEWTKNVSMDTLRTLAAEHLAIFTDTLLMKRLKGGVLLNEIISQMIQKSENNLKPNLNLMLYSAHDLTIVTLMRTLGFEELLKPDYGATLIFELHKTDDSYKVQLFYGLDFKQIPKKLTTAFCPTPCLLEDFKENLDAVRPTDWENECLK